MATYFGQDSGTDTIQIAEIWWAAAGYACPGSGNQSLLSMEVLCGGGGGNLRMGLYDGTDLVVESDSELAAPGGGAWLSFTSFTWHVGSVLTGGTTYKIAVCSDASTNIKGLTGLASGTLKYASGDYTGGMPSTLPSSSDYTYEPDVRASVEAASAGIAIPVVMHHLRQMRG